MRILTFLFLASVVGAADLEKGRQLLKEGKHKAAELSLQAGGEAGSAEARLLRGLALVKQRDFQQAETVLKEAKELNAESGEAPTLLGWLYLEGLQDPGRAVPEFELAARLSPNSPEAHNNLGTAFNRLRQFDRAIDSYTRAIALKADYPEAISNRGWASLHSRDADAARRDFLAALALRPDDAGALLGLAQLARNRGDLAESASSYRRLLATAPNFVYVMDLAELYVRRYWFAATALMLACWIGLSVQKRRRLQSVKEE